MASYDTMILLILQPLGQVPPCSHLRPYASAFEHFLSTLDFTVRFRLDFIILFHQSEMKYW